MTPRIVSLIASATEIVCALGLEAYLVGRSHECDFPPSVKALPCCTQPTFDTDLPSDQIDRAVKDRLRDALSIYRIDGELLSSLEPDLIVTQSQCEVCAVSAREVERAVCAWLRRCPAIVSLRPNALADVWDDIARVALAAGTPDRGDDLIAALQARLGAIAGRAAAVGARPRVACVEWLAPLMAAGNWVPELVALAGGESLFGEAGGHAPWLTWEQLRGADPDVIALMPCGFDIARARAEMPALTAQPGWGELAAVRGGRVYLTDGNQYFNRPGPRLVESLEVLAELLHPGAFAFGHEGAGWRRWAPGAA